jgi:hypothetical protein
MEEQYPTSEVTDHKIIMKDIENNEVPLPERILVVSPNSFTVDQLLSYTSTLLGDTTKLLRLGHSLENASLNSKYSIDHLSGSIALTKSSENKQAFEHVDDLKRRLLESSPILFLSF